MFQPEIFQAFAKPDETNQSHLSNIFGTMSFSIENYLMSPKDPLSIFFDVLQQIGFSKSPKGTLFTIFDIVRFFKKNNFRLKIKFSQWSSALYPNF